MRPYLLKPNALLICSIIGSLLLHGAIFTNVIVVFPALKEPHKPTIISLGAILGSTEMTQVIDAEMPDPAPLGGLDKIKDASQLYTGSSEKPWQPQANDPRVKRTLKTAGSPIADDDIKPQTPPPQVDNAKIEYSVEAYKPLRYKDND